MIGDNKTTQDFVPIREIRDELVVLKDGSMRALLIVSSLNFGLKSADEKQAILLQYQNFLNSLDFDVQIFVQSRRLNIKPYLSSLDERLKAQTNELLKIQTKEYIEFIKYFTESNDIMSKYFYVVVPYSPPVVTLNQGTLSRLLPFGQKKEEKRSPEDAWREDKTQLEQRIGVVSSGLKRVGLRAERLGTEELVEIFFKMFNPGETEIPTVANQ